MVCKLSRREHSAYQKAKSHVVVVPYYFVNKAIPLDKGKWLPNQVNEKLFAKVIGYILRFCCIQCSPLSPVSLPIHFLGFPQKAVVTFMVILGKQFWKVSGEDNHSFICCNGFPLTTSRITVCSPAPKLDHCSTLRKADK